jgi:hypothetical protein
MGGGSAWIKPGKRKSSGDTLLDALMPLHPVTSKRAGKNASRRNLRFDLNY